MRKTKFTIFFLTIFLLGITFYISLFFHENINIEIQEWEINKEIPNDINQKQYEGWGVIALGEKKSERKPVRKVKVAIIDSGIDKNHIDLQGVVKKEFNAIDERMEVVDDTGHGTAVAGIIGAIDNGIGIKGVFDSDFLEIYSIKAFQDGHSEIEHLERAMEWAIENEVDLINFSAGTGKISERFEELINQAVEKNIIIVAAAGNRLNGNVDYPARLNNVISVGAVNYKLNKVSLTSYGQIDFVAPGSHIITTQPGNQYDFFGYTSAATAFVSGVILNEISKYPDKNSYNYQSIYEHFAKKAIDLGEQEKFGNGFVRN